jgi:hypothetical protein
VDLCQKVQSQQSQQIQQIDSSIRQPQNEAQQNLEDVPMQDFVVDLVVDLENQPMQNQQNQPSSPSSPSSPSLPGVEYTLSDVSHPHTQTQISDLFQPRLEARGFAPMGPPPTEIQKELDRCEEKAAMIALQREQLEQQQQRTQQEAVDEAKGLVSNILQFHCAASRLEFHVSATSNHELKAQSVDQFEEQLKAFLVKYEQTGGPLNLAPQAFLAWHPNWRGKSGTPLFIWASEGQTTSGPSQALDVNKTGVDYSAYHT